MTEEEILQLRQDVENLKNSFSNFSFKVNKKIGGSGVKEVVAQISDGSKLVIGQGNNVFKADENGIYLGNAVFASAPFRVSPAGALTATSATISGSVTANAIDAGTGNSSAHIDSNGNLWVGHADYASAPAKISNAGVATFVSATLTGSTVNLSQLTFQDINGDGTDGNVTISSNTSLSRDMYYDSLTVNNGAILDTAGYRIFAKTKITVTANSYIQRTPEIGGNGGNASDYLTPGAAGAASASIADGSLYGGLAGKVGTIGAVGKGITSDNTKSNGTTGINGASAGANMNKSLASADGVAGTNGSAGGNATTSLGGAATGGSGGTGTAGGTRTGTVFNTVRNSYAAYLLYDFLPSGEVLKSAPSNGIAATGGSGAVSVNDGDAFSGATGGSGGGGSQGGIVSIFAKEIQVDSGSYIQANGGRGGDAGGTTNSITTGNNAAAGGSAGSSGGNGGNGGILILSYSKLTNNGTVQAIGGLGGTGASAGTKSEAGTGTATAGTAGLTGTSGAAGTVIQLVV